MKSLITTDAHPGWTKATEGLFPGGHIAVFAEHPGVTLEGRFLGLELRDTILVLRPGLSSSVVFLFRKQITEETIAEQIFKTGTGGLNIDACRVPSGGEHFRSTVMGRSGGMVASDPRTGAALGMFQEGAVFEPTNHEGGRWPSNLVLVHSSECRKWESEPVATWECEPSCCVKIFNEQEGSDGSARFYPQFKDDAELVDWIERLVTAP